MCNLIEVESGHARGPTMGGMEQVKRLEQLAAGIVCAQEVTGRYLDLCARKLGPECASRQIRYLGHHNLDTRQCMAIFSRWPINQERSTNLGPFQADGIETTPTHIGLGERGLEAAVLAAEIVHPEGNFWAATGHFAWTPKAHEGLKPHQIEALRRASVFLEELRSTGLPIVLGADFNGLLQDCEPYMPVWMHCLISPDLRRQIGTTIDHSDEDTARKLTELGVYIDGAFASNEFQLADKVEIITGLSDHKGHLIKLVR